MSEWWATIPPNEQRILIGLAVWVVGTLIALLPVMLISGYRGLVTENPFTYLLVAAAWPMLLVLAPYAGMFSLGVKLRDRKEAKNERDTNAKRGDIHRSDDCGCP